MKKVIFVLLALFMALNLYSQNTRVVSGVVRDAAGNPVIGAVVMVEGSTSNASVTDANGAYKLTVAVTEKTRLNASCISYKTVSLPVSTNGIVNFTLEDDTEELEEVVVVGYGAMRRSDLTGSVTTVKIDETEAAQSTSMDKLLQGRSAGMQVVNNSADPNAGVSIVIRGVSSFQGDSQPLFVVDGVIINSKGTNDQLLTQGADNVGSAEQTNGLMGINPQDIASIEVLKDASATAIYGAEGANGVVLVTTKTAQKDRPVVNFSAGVDISSAYKKMEMMSLDEYADFLTIVKPSYLSRIYSNPGDRSTQIVDEVDWQDYTMRTGIGQRYYVSVAGRPKWTSYLFSIGFNNLQGIVRESDVSQYTMRLNLDKDITTRLKIGTRTSFGYVASSLTQGANAGRLNGATSLMLSMLMSRPYITPGTDLEEEFADDNIQSSPKVWLEDLVNSFKTYRITPSVYLQYQIAKGFRYKFYAGLDANTTERAQFKSERIVSAGSEGSNAVVYNRMDLRFNIDNMLTYNTKFKGGHVLDAMADFSISDRINSMGSLEGWQIKQWRAKINSINAAEQSDYRFTQSEVTMLSGLARIQYNYKDRYLLTTSFRLDGSSNFVAQNRFAFFPSLAFAWRLNKENWFNVDWISTAKARLGWGRVGNSSVDAYSTFYTYSASRVPDHMLGDAVVGYYPDNLANPNLKWETTQQLNGGLDLAFWKGRLALTLDLYTKTTYDLLTRKTVPYSTGFRTVWSNEGTINNRGIELTVDATPVASSGFEWQIGGNISFNRNKIVTIANDPEVKRVNLSGIPGDYVECSYFEGDVLGGGSVATYPINFFFEGQPMSLFYGFKTDGIVQQGETGIPMAQGDKPRAPGSIKYCDLNGNGYLDDEDRTVIGDPNPDFTYGFNTRFTYRRVSLALNFVGSQGNDIMNLTALVLNNYAAFESNHIRTPFVNAWTTTNPTNEYPSVDRYESSDAKLATDRNVEDGSYLRLSSASLSYDIPIRKNNFLKALNITASAGNIYTWTKYTGWDPDVNSFGARVQRKGIDVGSYPGARTFSFDIKFTF